MPAKGRAKASAAPAAARAKRRAPGSKGFAAVCRALQNGQKSNATHKRLSGQLLSTQAQWGTEGASFADSLWQALCHVLPSALTQGVDKIMRLVQQLLAAQPDNDLTLHLVKKALDVVHASDKHVRRNVCELICCCMHAFKQDVENTEDTDILLDKIVDAIHDRLDDKVVSIRCKAVDAAFIFQQPTLGPDCDVTQHYLQLLCQDVPQVRVAVMHRLEVSKSVMPHLLRCTSDASVLVRKAAYKHVARVPGKWLSYREKTDLLTRGLSERTAELRKLTHTIIGNWLAREAGDAVAVLKYLVDVEDTEKLMIQVAEVIFELKYAKPKLTGGGGGAKKLEKDGKETDSTTPPPADEEAVKTVADWDLRERDRLCDVLSPEGMLMLRVVISQLKLADSERLETYLPKIDTTTGLLRTCLNAYADPDESPLGDDVTPKAGLLAEQVLKLCLVYEPDLHTEGQRQEMLKAVYTFANVAEVDHPTRFVEPVILLFRHFYQHRKEELYRLVMLIIDRLRSYMSTTTDETASDAGDLFFDAEAQSRAEQQKQDVIAQLTVKVAALRKADDRSLAETETQLNTLVAEANTDTALWVRILHIIFQMTQQPRGTQITLQYADVALAAAQNHWNGFVRAKALRVLAAYAVMQKQTAPTYTKVMLAGLRRRAGGSAIQNRLTVKEAINGVFDAFLEHGALAFFTSPVLPPPAEGAEQKEEDASARARELAVLAEESAVKVLRVLLHLASEGEQTWGADDGSDGGGADPSSDDAAAEESPQDADARRRLTQGTTTAGLAKLLACNRIPKGHEPTVLAQLLLFYFSPTEPAPAKPDGILSAEDDACGHAMQILTVFFPTYSFSSPHRQALVSEACLIALRHIARDTYRVVHTGKAEAAGGSAKKSKLASFLSFAAHLTDAAELKVVQRKLKGHTPDASALAAEESQQQQQLLGKNLKPQQESALAPVSLHEAVAAGVLLDMLMELTDGDPSVAKRVHKLLGYLSMYNAQRVESFQLLELTDRVANEAVDKQLVAQLQKFRDAIAAVAAGAKADGKAGDPLVGDGGEAAAGAAAADEGEKQAGGSLDTRVAAHKKAWQAAVQGMWKPPAKREGTPTTGTDGKRKRKARDAETDEADDDDGSDSDAVPPKKRGRAPPKPATQTAKGRRPPKAGKPAAKATPAAGTRKRRRGPLDADSDDSLEFTIKLDHSASQSDDGGSRQPGTGGTASTPASKKSRLCYSSKSKALFTENDSENDDESSSVNVRFQ